jgi:iron complex outermembrane receptor protein
VDGFTVANLRVARQLPWLGQRGEVFVSVENLFDKDYSFRPGYPMAGRSFQVGVHASF